MNNISRDVTRRIQEKLADPKIFRDWLIAKINDSESINIEIDGNNFDT